MPNRKQRRATAEVGMQVHIRGFITTAPDGSRQHWWVPVAPGMGDEEALRQEWHGPFRTQAEASADEVRTLLGPQCKVTEGGMWDPAWDKPQ